MQIAEYTAEEYVETFSLDVAGLSLNTAEAYADMTLRPRTWLVEGRYRVAPFGKGRPAGPARTIIVTA